MLTKLGFILLKKYNKNCNIVKHYNIKINVFYFNIF